MSSVDKPAEYPLDEEELATVLAALRFYQRNGMGEPANRPDWLQDIAVPNEDATSLDDAAIDQLCERLNCPPTVAAKRGINPVTIRTPGQPHVTIARLHVGDGDTLKKNLTVALFPADGANALGMAVLDEDKFINALGHLFPHKELDRAWTKSS